MVGAIVGKVGGQGRKYKQGGESPLHKEMRETMRSAHEANLTFC